ncbi:MAG: sulfurtransferase-like selenium metabolism protein YedF, partial [Eubacteriales bacterium]|nr:sulfurtransferase-like selenium metabolism protein YedF [Eubacteriales bacterium]
NRGIFLTTSEDEELLSDLRQLEKRGAKIYSCGLCLSHYERLEALQIGAVSNMYELCDLMCRYRVLRP